MTEREHSYIPSPDTEKQPYGALECEHCCLPAEGELVWECSLPLLSSGRHQFQNLQPWAIIEKFEGQETVSYRTNSRADVERAFAGWQGEAKIEWDPIPWDGVPLNHPGNPIIADVRAEDGSTDWAAVAWWWSMINDIAMDWHGQFGNPPVPGYVRHARRVLHLMKRLHAAA